MNAPVSSQIPQGLEQLRDIRLPGEIAWWPLAPGWWIVAGVVAASAVIAVLWSRKRRRSLRQRALNELESIRSDDELATDPARLAEMLGGLLKRVILQQPQAREHANATGDRWREFLLGDSTGGMDEQVAEFLTVGPYAAQPVGSSQPPKEDLFESVARWIRRNT